MTSISTVGQAEANAVPKAKSRNLALDRARTFLTLVVLLHHAVIPYTYFGHTDPKSFFGFDMIVLATDSFFMAMFFFLSGLFVWPGLKHKTPRAFFGDRLLRLGLPFVICAFTVIGKTGAGAVMSAVNGSVNTSPGPPSPVTVNDPCAVARFHVPT